MGNLITNEDLDRWVSDKLDSIVDNGTDNSDIFDALCDSIDEKFGAYNPYVRIFWHVDNDSLEDLLNEILGVAQQFDVFRYCVNESIELDATIMVVLLKQKQGEDID